MLINKNQFRSIEGFLVKNKTIEHFEKENGKILGRMMITKAEIPQNIQINTDNLGHVHAFNASFDFYNTVLGVAIKLPEKEFVSDLWMIAQDKNQDEVDKAWIDFFLQTLLENIEDNGCYGIPMYSFVNDTSSFTVIPTK